MVKIILFTSVQSKAMVQNLAEGAAVMFKAGQGQKGPQAEEVEVV